MYQTLRKFIRNRGNFFAILHFIGLHVIVIALGILMLHLAIQAVSHGELEIPRKYSRPIVLVTPMKGAAFYYGFLVFYLAGGVALIAAVIASVLRICRATPDQRVIMIAAWAPSPRRQPRRIVRSLLLFAFVPLVSIFIILFAMIRSS